MVAAGAAAGASVDTQVRALVFRIAVTAAVYEDTLLSVPYVGLVVAVASSTSPKYRLVLAGGLLLSIVVHASIS